MTQSSSGLAKPALLSRVVSGRTVRVVGLLTLAVLAGIIFWQNWARVETPVLFMTVNMPRSLFMASVLVIGFVVGFLTGRSRQRAALRR